MQDKSETGNGEHPEPDLTGHEDAPAESATATPDASAAEGDETAELRARLQDAEARAAANHEAWLRAMADAENTRRRSKEEANKAHKFAIERFATSLLAIKDSLEATLAAENASLESLTAGVELTLKQLVGAFQSADIAEVAPNGEKFDPHRHQAISTVESDGEPNRVVTVLQKGYLLHERVLRPALVIVSRAAETAGNG
ncbi:MAG: nucleotide exchange factor GrpE [Betaproteobacteria bacterium]|nr:nucleotide exchange factor GrpE [Betaproteobacteria bacterium]